MRYPLPEMNLTEDARADTSRKALFAHEDGGYRPSRWAQGPWNPRYLHGGPTAALLAHVLEAERRDEALFLARVTVDLFKPVPHELLKSEVRTLRSGNRIQVVDAQLSADGSAVARASGVFLRRSAASDPVFMPLRELPSWRTLPESYALGRPDEPEERFHRAVEARRLEIPFQGRPMIVWVRAPFDFVPGVPLSAIERVAAVADFVNAFGSMSAARGKSFINADLSLYLFRELEGEWVCLESVGRGDRDGIATSNINLHDERGLLGHVACACVANDIR